MDSKEFGEALAAFTARMNKAIAALNSDLVNMIDKIDEAIDKATDAFRRNHMIFNEEDKAVYEPPNDLILKSEAVQAIAEYEMYGAQMDNPGTASDNIEDWKELGEMILHDVQPIEPMPRYIDNTLVARHYCNGMVAMNEKCYRRLQKVKEPRRGKWIQEEPVGNDQSIYRCNQCGMAYVWDTVYTPNFCPNCGTLTRKEAKIL